MEFQRGDLVKHEVIGILEITEVVGDNYVRLKPHKVKDGFTGQDTFLLNIKMAPLKLYKKKNI